MERSRSHLVLIPSYNPGAKVYDTVKAARAQWNPVWVIVDGSTDDTAIGLQRMAQDDPGLRVEILPHNQGKGAAVLHGLQLARTEGFTHVMTMDADGQHPAAAIPGFMARSAKAPDAMVLGMPQFGPEAPKIRVWGRKLSNAWANLETLWMGIGDSLFGFRVYPVTPLIDIMLSQRWMRRFDFDPEAAVRLCWHGIRPINVPCTVRYFRANEGGVSHFHYVRDNLLLSGMHGRLLAGFVWRLPSLLVRRFATARMGSR